MNKRKKKVILFLSIFSFIFITVAVSIYLCSFNEQEQEKYPLFERSFILQNADPYGLSNENNIIGKEISEVLFGYIEGEDYTVASSENLTTYEFPISENYFCLGSNPKLLIYVPNDDSIIDSIGYSFRYSSIKEERTSLYFFKNEITNYYDVDPIYSYLNGQENITTDNDTFYSLSHDEDFKTIYSISWKNSTESAVFILTELYDEKRERGIILFR
jgi:hypothetical protein